MRQIENGDASKSGSFQTVAIGIVEQLGLGILNYKSAKQHLPPSSLVDLSVTSTGNNGSWGVQQNNLRNLVDLESGWDSQQAINDVRISSFQCPSDPGSQESRVFSDDRPILWPTNYGFN